MNNWLFLKFKMFAEFFLPQAVFQRMAEEGPQRYFFHTGWNLSGRILNMAISFLVSIYVVRYLGPSNWGLLSYVVSFTGIFSFLASLGVDNILYVDLVSEPENSARLLGTGFMLKAAGALLSFVLIMVSAQVVHAGFYTAVLMAIVGGALFFQPFNVINLYFQAKVKSKPTVINSVAIGIFLASLKVLLVFLGLSLKYFALLYLIEGVLAAAGYLFIYKKYGQKIFNWKFDFKLAKVMLGQSWPLILSTGFVYVYSRIDQVMLKSMLDQSAVGLYDVGVRLSEVWYVFPTIIIGSLAPALINAKKIGQEMYFKRLAKLYSFAIYFALIFILPLALFSKFIVNLLYGGAFIAAAGVLSIYVWAGVSVSVGSVVNQYLINEKYTKIALFLNFFGMATNILLNLYLIPKYGINGAAMATLISYSLIPVSVIFFKRSRYQLRLILDGLFLKTVI
ncbi:MAG: flippase [Candidatus Doudnabacteria bacterium CG10_big_fil_rev_8_21_14_0_10_42_18]|uniref:Flippase n=1 Tax=Candidatus Doudnabacteria bacterium CG10_big_fil_rev_8_21_14_0_10_42_18 TaxID=1974552 RepID=A0A2H0V9Y3_9BACT|nr:MAG: flippase [Candidatus Doudnabacteria bacterium CG10_big_fil_rev_8_21_14_0_10_42_18]